MSNMSGEILCSSDRMAICRAGCCRLPFQLTDEEAKAGHARWHSDFPYHILQGKDGYCVHLDRATMRCDIYENRPTACRRFDCRTMGIPAVED